METASELLRRYAEDGSETAFRQLVQSTLPLVYGCAMRRLGDTHLAQDAAQRVYTDLARKARKLCARPVLASWLYTSTHYAASNIARAEARRRSHETRFPEAMGQHSTPDSAWEQIRPLIDEELHRLAEADRTALVLRFLEERTYSEVAQVLRTSEEAARKRVERSLERLRHRLASRGIASSAALLSGVLSTQMAEAAPASVATLVASTALSQASAVGGAGIVSLMTTSKIGIVAGAVLAAVSLGTVATEASRYLGARAELSEAAARRDAAAQRLAAQKSAASLAAGSGGRTTQARTAQAQGSPQSAGARPRGPGAGPFPDSLARGFEFMKRHPELKAAVADFFAAQARVRYGPILAPLHLAPDQEQRALTVLGWGGFGRMLQSGEVVTLSPGDPAGLNDAMNEVHAMIGDGAYAAYEAANRTYEAQAQSLYLAGTSAVSGDPLSADQLAQVRTILMEATAGPKDAQSVDWDAALAKAQPVLSAGQFETLQLLANHAAGWQHVIQQVR